MKTSSRLGLYALILAAVAAGGLWAWRSGSNGADTAKYKLAKVETGPLAAVVSATGTLNPVVSVQVGSQVSGQIKEILVDFNSPVKSGQLIARLDPETYQHRVRQAEADVDAARAAQGVQQAEVARARANLSNAQRDYERKKTLVEKNFISPAERDTAQNTLDAARASLASAEAQVRNGEAIVRQREAQLAAAHVDLTRTSITAPVDGVVVKRSIEPGQTVAASLQAPELFVIAKSLTDMQVETSIDEADVGRVRLGQKATFTVDAFAGRHFEGEVRQVRKAATVVSNVVTYTVVISAANPDLTLLPGMTANVRIITARKDKVLKVPNAALRYRPAGSTDEKKPSTATPAAVVPAPTSGGGGTAQIRERLVAELRLDAEQQGKLDAIFAGMRDKFMAARDLPEAEKSKAQERNRAEIREKVAAMLTPEQKLRYDELGTQAAAARSGAGGGSGRLWIVGGDGKPQAVELRLGLTDGSMTEIVSGDLKEAQEVITGQQAAAAPKAAGMPAPRLF
ncbi:HlyD family efflux transporter periplasmic adaptor subunit [Sulfuritalea sp.]|uniref:efflux RND transporter periplasmic adaptor subunit n=1 Tax=Sulfuritalea sp. TaxID=2480090 RepID=UPI001ACD3E94|nr:HlyD family efflux transporter periplasmic adaptor subunit [Sulfuritalea sp.]MBN8473421.1 efflux RND transporter periplasmic adaptor subunit [Sulfuritalea sp.]